MCLARQVTSQIRGIIDGTITDFEAFDQQLALKERAKQIRQEESQASRHGNPKAGLHPLPLFNRELTDTGVEQAHHRILGLGIPFRSWEV